MAKPVTLYPPDKLTEGTAKRLWDAFSKAGLAWKLNEVPIPVTLRKEANKTLGQTRRELLRVAGLGTAMASLWMDKFIAAMEQDPRECVRIVNKQRGWSEQD